MSRFEANAAVDALYAAHGLPVLVGAAIDDGAGGAFIQVAYVDMSPEDGEHIVATFLRQLIAQMSEDSATFCDACHRRLARLSDALTTLERDGDKPTGKARGHIN